MLALPAYPDPAQSFSGFYNVSDQITATVRVYAANDRQGYSEIFTIAERVAHDSDSKTLQVGAGHAGLEPALSYNVSASAFPRTVDGRSVLLKSFYI